MKKQIVPLFPCIHKMKEIDPEWFELHRHNTPLEGIKAFMKRNPDILIEGIGDIET